MSLRADGHRGGRAATCYIAIWMFKIKTVAEMKNDMQTKDLKVVGDTQKTVFVLIVS